MARQNSKPGARSGKAQRAAMPERRLTVEQGFYNYPPPEGFHHLGGRTVQVPQLRLKGRWLEQAGFSPRTKVAIIVRRGRLVVEVR